MTDLAGRLLLRPGVATPHNLHSSRRAWATQLAPGRPASTLPGLLAGLHSLCGPAHRLASQGAIHAAAPDRFDWTDGVGPTLQRDTALEHLRRIGLDGPRLLARPDRVAATTAQATDSLRRCPLIVPTPHPTPWAALRRWLQDDWLGMEPAAWMRAWQTDGADWLHAWSRRPGGGWLPDLLRQAQAFDTPLPPSPTRALRPHAHGDLAMRGLDAELSCHEGADPRPRWQGQTACTGPWTRRHLDAPARPWTAWALLGVRLAELVRLSLPDAPGESGAGWLTWGALGTGPRRGLAWVEMARGLLVHRVTLDDAPPGAMPTVRACQVLAPTDWNMHPEGLAAQALAGLPADAPKLESRVRLLMAALDPCVPFDIEPPTRHDHGMEASHA